MGASVKGNKMKDIEIFLLLNDSSPDLDSSSTPSGYGVASDELKRQSRVYNLGCEIHTISRSQLPDTVESKIVGIFNGDSLINKKYLLCLVSLNNMFQDTAVFCGSVTNHFLVKPKDTFLSSIANIYQSYKLDSVSKYLVRDITGEVDNYPITTNLFISKPAYNNIGGLQELMTPRGACFSNPNFAKACEEYGRIIYSENLSTKNLLYNPSFSMNDACRFFYDLGYISGLKHKMKTSEDENYDFIWDIFVESPDSLEHRVMGRIFFDGSISEDQRSAYAQNSAMAKTVYQVGFFEAVSGNVIL